MPVEGTVDESTYRLRQTLGSGEIEGQSVDISVNADGAAVFIEFDDTRVMYDTRAMVADAYRMVYDSGSDDDDAADAESAPSE